MVKQGIITTRVPASKLKIISPIVPTTLAPIVTGDQIAKLVDRFKKLILALV